MRSVSRSSWSSCGPRARAGTLAAPPAAADRRRACPATPCKRTVPDPERAAHRDVGEGDVGAGKKWTAAQHVRRIGNGPFDACFLRSHRPVALLRLRRSKMRGQERIHLRADRGFAEHGHLQHAPEHRVVLAGKQRRRPVFLRQVEHHRDRFVERRAAVILEERHRAQRIEREIGRARRERHRTDRAGPSPRTATPRAGHGRRAQNRESGSSTPLCARCSRAAAGRHLWDFCNAAGIFSRRHIGR